ncbi:MAG: DUF2752 domain-containing protein [Terracidiphilus sp.]|nr:DUF2752 domain-containing protein [Terracidiphilus sp.]
MKLSKHTLIAREILTVLAVPLLAVAYGLVVDPETGRHGVSCLWKTLTGHNCPGCGLTRAWAFLLRGRWHEAGTMNWLIFPSVAIYASHIVLALVRPAKRAACKFS